MKTPSTNQESQPALGLATGSAMPSTEDRRRAIAIRMASKRGQYVSAEDMKFCTRLWKKYPDWYASTEADVFNATVPFGSNVRVSSPNKVDMPSQPKVD